MCIYDEKNIIRMILIFSRSSKHLLNHQTLCIPSEYCSDHMDTLQITWKLQRSSLKKFRMIWTVSDFMNIFLISQTLFISSGCFSNLLDTFQMIWTVLDLLDTFQIIWILFRSSWHFKNHLDTSGSFRHSSDHMDTFRIIQTLFR